MKVTVNAGADFVFDDEYKLKSLKEVEKFIDENSHLPEIASAKEMEEKGLELGKMDIKLLQKIEELTLYLIGQNKKIETLEAKILDLVASNYSSFKWFVPSPNYRFSFIFDSDKTRKIERLVDESNICPVSTMV